MSTYVSVEISPDTTTRPVFTSVSHATRPVGSSAITASRTPSEIWSATLSGWPSVTDSDVNRYSFSEKLVLIGWTAAPRSGKWAKVGRGRVAGELTVGSRQSAVGSWLGSADCRLSTLGVALLSAPVIDDQRYAFEPVALAQPVLQEEAVVPGQAGAVVHLDGEAGWADVVLGHVDQLQALAAHVRRLA